MAGPLEGPKPVDPTPRGSPSSASRPGRAPVPPPERETPTGRGAGRLPRSLGIRHASGRTALTPGPCTASAADLATPVPGDKDRADAAAALLAGRWRAAPQTENGRQAPRPVTAASGCGRLNFIFKVPWEAGGRARAAHVTEAPSLCGLGTASCLPPRGTSSETDPVGSWPRDGAAGEGDRDSGAAPGAPHARARGSCSTRDRS